MKIYEKLSQHLGAWNNCCDSGNTEWKEKHWDTVEKIMEGAPSGSGFDNGTELQNVEGDWDKSLVFSTSFHHMDDNGYYDGWTEHVVTIYPRLSGNIGIRVSGINKRDIKEYIAECFIHWLTADFKD